MPLQDIVTRFAHSNGFYVERRFGWDTHGLPVEHEIDKKLGITSKADVMAMGIDKYNAECRAIVMRYSSEWRRTVERLGRWIDFDNDYKTLNTPFMESVWWVFGQLWKKDLVYRGLKVMPYTPGCTTPLSNFEAGQAYKDVQDPAGAFRSFEAPDRVEEARLTLPPSYSHRRLQARRGPLHCLPRLDHHPLDSSFQPRTLRSPRAHLRSDPRRRARPQVHPLRQAPHRSLQGPHQGQEGQEVHRRRHLQGNRARRQEVHSPLRLLRRERELLVYFSRSERGC